MTATDSFAVERPLRLTPTNLAYALGGVPRFARRALSLALHLDRGELNVRIPDGREFVVHGSRTGPSADIRINSYRFASRLLRNGEIGFAEAYVDGLWDSPDLTKVLELFCVNRDAIDRNLSVGTIARIARQVGHWLNRNTRRGARRNIEAHYDLGNRFFSQWLDDTATYSSALFEGRDRPLDEAQRAKYHALATAMDLRPGESVLEIGCGWGGFAEYAARQYGARVTAVTISRKQYEFACRRVHEQGLAERVDIRYEDYRDTRGVFDRVASIEMFEAVGEKYWPVYFACLRDRLKAEGRAALQVITIRDDVHDSYRRKVDFIQRYIFPGGMLPSPSILGALAGDAGFSVAGERRFGLDYARTLAIWHDRFQAAWPEIERMGFDDRFRRLWAYYLCYCEAGFRTGNTDVCQIALARS